MMRAITPAPGIRLDGPMVLAAPVAGASGGNRADTRSSRSTGGGIGNSRSTAGVGAALALAEQQGWRTTLAGDPAEAAHLASARKAALVLVFGDMHFAVAAVRAVRQAVTVPILVLASLDSMARARVLVDGADAVLPADVGPGELHGWIGAVLRRTEESGEPQVRYLSAGDAQIDLWSRECRVRGREVLLSPTEFRLLVYLMRHPNTVLPRLKIVRHLWGSAGSVHDLNALRIQVSRLRRKITAADAGAELIRSVRSVGYEFTQNVVELGADQGHRSPELSSLGLSRTILEVAPELLGRPREQAAEYLTATLRASVAADAAAVFRREGDRLELVAESGNSERWRAVAGEGIPLRPGYAQAHAIETRQPTQVTDINHGPQRFRETARALATDGLHGCLFVPILTADGGWGGLGLASRSSRPFEPAALTFCVAATALFAMSLR